jgi:hypothetical protein
MAEKTSTEKTQQVWNCPACPWQHTAHPRYGWQRADERAVEVHQTMLCPSRVASPDREPSAGGAVANCRTCGDALTEQDREEYVDQCGWCAANGCDDDCPEDCMADHRGEQ